MSLYDLKRPPAAGADKVMTLRHSADTIDLDVKALEGAVDLARKLRGGGSGDLPHLVYDAVIRKAQRPNGVGMRHQDALDDTLLAVVGFNGAPILRIVEAQLMARAAELALMAAHRRNEANALEAAIQQGESTNDN